MQVFLSTRPEKRMLSDEVWDQAEGSLKAILDKMGRPYKINPGDGAFYGPKIDFKFKDALKRDWQLATIQLDFSMPEKFELEYTGSDNAPHRPVMVHRAVLGSLERFMGVMIEHFAGAFPFWLAPVQCRLIPIGDAHVEYCKEFGKKLQRMGIRFEIDDRNEKMGLKTREAQMQKVPMMFVAGDREMADGQFAVRKYGAKDSEVLKIEDIIALIVDLNSVPTKPFDV
jgi:threonyl-tRNA synthetase